MATMTEDQKEEQHAYECGRDIFYGLLFGVIPKKTAEEIVDGFKETFGTDDITECFFEHYAKEEGFKSLEDVKEFVVFCKAMKSQPKKIRELFLSDFPCKRTIKTIRHSWM